MNLKTYQTVIRGFQQDDLEDYVQGRLEDLYKQFETVKPENLTRLQGRIEEVKLLLVIREQALGVLDQARKS